MVNVEIHSGTTVKHVFTIDKQISVAELWNLLERDTDLSRDHFYVVYNGKLAYEDDVCRGGCARIIPKLLGGKGGFGSMLRAIGAQIEKTTNREACRDLSGRRLRDINEEKRLKAWIEKQAKREKEAEERKKKKLERLCAEPKHEFKDKNYDRERSLLTERVGDAVEEGFKAASTSGVKRKCEEEPKPSKKKTLLDMDIDSDELDTSDDSDDEAELRVGSRAEQQTSNDSGHSSDESDKSSKKRDGPENEHSEASTDNQITDNESSVSDDCKKNDTALKYTSESVETKVQESTNEQVPATAP